MKWVQYSTDQLSRETGEPEIGSIQARIMQCGFLLARGRVNRCWSLFGEVVTLIYKLRLHKRNALHGPYSFITVECEKRVFWAAFSLDKYLSCNLNRPQRLRRDDTDQVRFTVIFHVSSSLYEISDSLPLLFMSPTLLAWLM
jgi:hypothetical protein